ncbi:MAG TPA: cytochrome c [Acidimicrobiales bacterium]|jgi:quinoprotein glucose dehydrogenase|nr:cytochrome c [Acidimicrobiales bacterium]
MRSHFLTLVLVLSVLFTAGCVGSAPDVPEGSDQSLIQGRKVWTTFCISCHGPTGSGGRGPSLREIENKYPDTEDISLIVNEGREAMPSFNEALDPEEVKSVIRYILEVL